MQITLKMRRKSRASPVAAVRRTIAAVRPALGSAAEVSELFPGVTTGNRAGMLVVQVSPKSVAEADAVLQALRARDDVVYAEVARGRTIR